MTFVNPKSKMHILWDCRSVAPFMGGIGRATVGWLDAFLDETAKSEWNVSALFSKVCTEDFIRHTFKSTSKLHTIHFADAGLIDPVFEQFHLPSLLAQLGIDLYFNTCFSIPAIKTTPLTATVVHDVVFLDHPDLVDPNLRDYLANATNLSMNHADIIFTVSEFSKQRIAALRCACQWPSRSVNIIHPALSEAFSEMAFPQRRTNKKNKYILYLGAIEKKKGIDVLLDAYSILKAQKDTTEIRLVLAGGRGGQSYDIEASLEKRKLSASVDVLGPIDENKKKSLYLDADIFVFPSNYEGFGIPPLEAMACGIPVVASRASAIPEVLGDSALYFEPNEPTSLASQIRNVLDNPNLQNDMTARGYRHSKTFNWKSSSRIILDAIALGRTNP